MSLTPENDSAEKHANGELGEKHVHTAPGYDPENIIAVSENKLHQDLKGRHMQMIAMQVEPLEGNRHLNTNVCI